MSDPSHPRDPALMRGQEASEATFLQALETGRLHHAWLLTGPEGVGKASFAYRAARRLLGARPDPGQGPLGSQLDDPVTRQVSARSHPDLLVLEKLGEDGKVRRNIPVEEARRLPEFFAMAPASAPYRVAIIDAADDLNVNAANAVLKTLEEPPARGILFLVSHAPGKLLPTIRSRCRRMGFAAWSQAELTDWLAGQGIAHAERLAAMAQGSPGRALALSAENGEAMDHAAHEVLAGADPAALLHLADSFRGAEGAHRFSMLFQRLAAGAANRARDQAMAGEGGEAWAKVWESLLRLPAEAEALNLDRADVLFTAVREIAAARR